jgi:hypothetical protein
MALNYVVIEINNINPSFRQRVQLDGNFYDMLLDWNERDTCWLLSFYSLDGSPIVTGIKLVINYELLRQHKVNGMPAGSLVLLPVKDTIAFCGYEDLGFNCKLIYTVLE